MKTRVSEKEAKKARFSKVFPRVSRWWKEKKVGLYNKAVSSETQAAAQVLMKWFDEPEDKKKEDEGDLISQLKMRDLQELLANHPYVEYYPGMVWQRWRSVIFSSSFVSSNFYFVANNKHNAICITFKVKQKRHQQS